MSEDDDRTASLMTPAKLAQLKVRPAAAASPSVWLDQLASDAGSGHVRRLIDLRRQLEAQVRESDPAAAGQACARLARTLGELDLSLLQPRGWLARATGKGKEAVAGFRDQHAQCLGAGERLAEEVRTLQQRQEAQGKAIERSLVEFEVEMRAIEKIMDQGARWLQDMRGQLKAREAAGGDAATLAKIEDDNRRCEMLVARLKQLRAIASAAQQVVEHCKAAPTRRSALLSTLKKTVDGEWRGASDHFEALAGQAGAAAAESLEQARAARQRLGEVLRQAAADAESQHAQEQALGDEVAALQAPLEAAA